MQAIADKLSRLPAGLLGMIALIGLVEWRLGKLCDHVTTIEVGSWVQTGKAASSAEAVASDVLILGDSSVKLGLSPQVFAEASGLPAYNLALPAANAPAELFLLQRALAAGARPRALVVGFTPRLLMEDRWKAARFYAEMATPAELAALALDAGDATFLARELAEWALRTLRFRQELRGVVLGKLRGTWHSLRRQGRVYERNWEANRGGMMMPPASEEALKSVAENRAWLHDLVIPDPWRCERLCRTYIDRLFALADSRGIPVFWVLLPFQPPPEGPPANPRLDELRERSIRLRQARFRHLFVVDARQVGYPADLFLDPVHLNVRGASRFSADLGAAVAAVLADPPVTRWAELKSRPDLVVAAVPEDLAASRDAVKARWLARTR